MMREKVIGSCNSYTSWGHEGVLFNKENLILKYNNTSDISHSVYTWLEFIHSLVSPDQLGKS